MPTAGAEGPGGGAVGVEAVLADQIAYYRARAPEYDQWWNREGPWDLGPQFNASWAAEIDAMRAILDSFAPAGEVLELAAGTGGLTAELARHARSITAVDASAEALQINRAKLAGSGVAIDYVVADLFSWEPSQSYDVVFFSFWLSHVPAERFEAFWALVARSPRPGGRFFFLDNAAPRPELYRRFPGVSFSGSQPTMHGPRSETHLGEGIAIRELVDGRRFRIVKRYWAPEELAAELRALGWEAAVAETKWAFICGYGRRPADAGQSGA